MPPTRRKGQAGRRSTSGGASGEADRGPRSKRSKRSKLLFSALSGSPPLLATKNCWSNLRISSPPARSGRTWTVPRRAGVAVRIVGMGLSMDEAIVSKEARRGRGVGRGATGDLTKKLEEEWKMRGGGRRTARLFSFFLFFFFLHSLSSTPAPFFLSLSFFLSCFTRKRRPRRTPPVLSRIVNNTQGTSKNRRKRKNAAGSRKKEQGQKKTKKTPSLPLSLPSFRPPPPRRLGRPRLLPSRPSPSARGGHRLWPSTSPAAPSASAPRAPPSPS